ncbi:phage antirepressor Ant, partial [Escherichia coli]|nr:phage antirepressor Ant [Escherichia coli]
MRTSLVTREEMIEAIEQHTACISTRDIPGVIANYFMITKQLYRRKDKNAVHRILLSDIREYLLEQGHLNYATVAAETRKEAHRMKASKPDVVVTKPLTATTPAPVMDAIPNTGDTIDSQTLLKMVNEARKLCGENEIRNNDFLNRIKDELDGEFYETFVKSHGTRAGRSFEVITMTYKQALRVAARESKAVRRSLIDKLEELQQANSPTPSIPQTLPEALRLAAELAEQKMQLEQQLVAAAPKVDFADRVSAANGILIGNFAKVVGLKQNALFAWLRENGILIASG